MKKRYFILCGVCVIISLFFLIYQGTTYFMVLSKYFSGKEQYLQAYREACVAYGGSCEEVNGLVSLTIHYFDSVKGNFAYFIDHGTMAYGYLVPLLCLFSGLNFRTYLNTIFSLNAYRKKDYVRFTLSEMNKECLRCALSIYLSYLILWLFVGIVINPADSGELTKYFLSDVFGKNLYIDHQRWYYLMEGTIRFFFVPYVYAFLGTTIAYTFKRKVDIVILPLVFYYGVSFVAQFLITWNMAFIYVDPIAIMVNGAISGCSSLLLMLFTIVIYVICIIVVTLKSKKCDCYAK